MWSSSSSSWGAAVVLLLVAGSLVGAGADGDFAFDASGELEVEFVGRGGLPEGRLTAQVGRAFHLPVSNRGGFAGRTVKEYEAKRHGGKGLPSWLLFDKKSGVFWGVPLAQDVGVLRLSVAPLGDASAAEDLEIDVVEASGRSEGCSPDEDVTVLALLVDRNVRAIKPKQRIIAVSNVAKFFGLPYSAFTLKPQVQKDDLTDSSVVLAGPGNLLTRSSKFTSLIQVPVGCDGKLWASTAPIVHQLKQQARDGTISEVLRLPLIGWRVKTETRSVSRAKREVVGDDDLGSGDYNDGDYYDVEYDYDEEEDEKDDLGAEKVPSTTKVPSTEPITSTTTRATTTSTSTSTTTTTTSTTPPAPTTQQTTTHPHRHHHGEIIPSVDILRDHQHHTDETIPITSPMTTGSVTSTTPQSTLKPSPDQTPKPEQPEGGDYEETYDYGENYDDEDGDVDNGPAESETIVPDFTEGRRRETEPPLFEDTESLTTEGSTSKATTRLDEEEDVVKVSVTGSTSSSTTVAVVSSTTPAQLTTSSSAGTTEATTFQIIVDNAPELEFTTEIFKQPSTDPSTSPQTTPSSTTVSTSTTEFLPTDEENATTTVRQPPPTTTKKSPTTTTTSKPPTTTNKSPTTVREATESVEFHENFNPFIENRLRQQSVIAGKVFRFVIPEDTFKDFEDEYDLTYLLLDEYNRTVSNNSWLNFNPMRREIYGLPLERDVSKWVFWVKAFDRDGGSVQEKLLIQVQQHKLDLVVNHEFSLYIRIEKHQEFPHYIDWCLKVLRAFGKIYNTSMSEITVRNINNTNEPVIFTWSNDSLPINVCPKEEIEELYRKLTANDAGDPSRELNVALSPEMRVKKVLYKEMGVCEPQPQTPVTPPTNFSPILRNPVDHINATVGELLIFKVKDDTFYDPEDVDPRILNITLQTADRQPIPSENWLQFDSKNREFYGIPRKSGRSEYQLVCVDTGGLPARDSLEVVIYPSNKKLYNVEFSMNITNIPQETFVRSASLQRKFVEKLMTLFGDTTPSNVYLPPFRKSYDSTLVTWYNKSLPINYCAHEEIDRLESILHGKDNSISHRVYNEMEPEFRVSTIKVLLVHNCKPKEKEKRPEVSVPVEETADPDSGGDEYLITFVMPAVIIAVMLMLAALAAILLYRKRRMGKMNVEEDGRSSYGNKGIPVIFQEELEDKPEPGTKAPVILKDEKPPLAPPEYSKSGSVRLTDDSEPYQPPPPFARPHENGRQGRPKPTPTYRKPPPYVPP